MNNNKLLIKGTEKFIKNSSIINRLYKDIEDLSSKQLHTLLIVAQENQMKTMQWVEELNKLCQLLKGKV